MEQTLSSGGTSRSVLLRTVSGLGIAVASFMTMQHYFAANFPVSIWEGSFCDISAFFNCDSSAFSAIAAIAGVPIGYFGLALGGLVVVEGLFSTPASRRTMQGLLAVNLLGVVVLLVYSIAVLGSLCLLCTGYYIFSGLAAWVYLKGLGDWRALLRPSLRIAAVSGAVILVGALGMSEYHRARVRAQSGGEGAMIVEQFYSLPVVGDPSIISPYWSARSTDSWEDAPIRIVEYADFLCPDCLFLREQLEVLAEEFAGKINIAFQFFPLEAICNDVVEKDLHPGACELSWIAARDPSKFDQIHDEIFDNFRQARDPAWRRELATRYGVEDAFENVETRSLVERIIRTGAEYEKTHERYSHGIRSTPTMIINGRLVIGTFPIETLRSIFRALVAEHEQGESRFMENWERRGR